MAKRSIRRVTVDGDRYVWSRAHGHVETYEHQPCIETLTVYLEGEKRSPLRSLFAADSAIARKPSNAQAQWQVGYPEDGVVWQTGATGKRVNLNRPGVVVAIIRYAILNGWHPKNRQQPFIVADSFGWLEEIEFPAGES